MRKKKGRDRGCGAVIYVVRLEGDDTEEALEQEWDYLQGYCSQVDLEVLGAVTEHIGDRYGEAYGAHEQGARRFDTDFGDRAGGRRVTRSLEAGAGHLIVSRFDRFYDDPRRARRLIKQFEKTGVYVHLVDYFTPDQAAEHFDVSANQVRKWLREYKVEGDKVNGRWQVDQRSILDHATSFERNKAADDFLTDYGDLAFRTLFAGLSWLGNRKKKRGPA